MYLDETILQSTTTLTLVKFIDELWEFIENEDEVTNPAKYYKLENYEKIKNSEKIRWVYLKHNSLQIKQLAFKGYDDPKEILDFIKENIDYDKLFERALQKKITIFYEALNWDLPVDKINTLERFI